MSTTAVCGAEHTTHHPFTWTKKDLEALNVKIVDGDPSLPAHRTLHGTVSIDYALLDHVGAVYLFPKYWEFGAFFESCLTAKGFKIFGGSPIKVTCSTEPVQLQLPTGNIDLPGEGTYALSDMVFLVYITPAGLELQRNKRGWTDTGFYDDIAYYIAMLIAVSQQAANSLGETYTTYPARLAYPSDDGKQLNVLTTVISTSFLEKFKSGSPPADTLQVYRTVIDIGDGKNIEEFAKQAIACAPQTAGNPKRKSTPGTRPFPTFEMRPEELAKLAKLGPQRLWQLI